MNGALLETKDARVDAGGSPQLDGLTLATTATRVVVLGGATVLFEAASGMRKPTRGSVLSFGEPADAALRAGRLAGAPLDPALPAAWTTRAYVTWSARLAGRDGAYASKLAGEAIARLQLGALADMPLGKAPVHGRRATVVAAALATGARAIFLADPVAGLPDTIARSFGKILVSALEGYAWAVFAPRLPLGSPLSLEAEEAIVLEGSAVAAQGAPGELASKERTFALKVHGQIGSLADAAEARGAKVRRSASVLVVDLGDALTTRDLMALALESRAVIVELSPLTRALG